MPEDDPVTLDSATLDSDALDPDALARAEAALAKLSENYLTWAEADVASLRAIIGEIREHPSEFSADTIPDILWRLFRVAHDVKGQATTFGYPLVTEIGRRLCAVIEAGTPDIEMLSRHVEAIAEVIALRLTGDGGQTGQEILARLD